MNIIQNKKSQNNKNRVSEIYDALPEASRKSLLDYAEFLYQRDGSEEPVVTEKQAIARPQSESVVGAIKRLNQTYPMIERNNIFHETSSLMTEHVMQGRDATEVIDDLEKLFERHYQEFLQKSDNLT